MAIKRNKFSDNIIPVVGFCDETADDVGSGVDGKESLGWRITSNLPRYSVVGDTFLPLRL